MTTNKHLLSFYIIAIVSLCRVKKKYCKADLNVHKYTITEKDDHQLFTPTHGIESATLLIEFMMV